MVLHHEKDIKIILTNNSYLADFHTRGNTTTLLIVSPETDHLFSYEGDFEIIDVEVANSINFIDVILPYETSLKKAYPNPFNPTTNIRYDLKRKDKVVLSIYNISGQLVETLVNEHKNSGSYEINWNATSQTSGMYFIELKTSNEVHHQKLMLIK